MSKKTPIIEELRVTLEAAEFLADAEASEGHPDPIDAAIVLLREAAEMTEEIEETFAIMLQALRHSRDSLAGMFAQMQFHPDHKEIEEPLLLALSNVRQAIAKAEGGDQ